MSLLESDILAWPSALDSSVNTFHSGEAEQQRNNAEAVSGASE